MSDQKNFYGWRIVFVCFCSMTLTMGLVLNSNGLFIKPICEELGFTRPQLSINTTLLASGQMLLALLSGRVFKHFKIRTILLSSCIVLSISTAGFAFAQNLPQFYILSAFAGLAMGGTCVIPVSLLINNWFHKKRGTAIGMSMTGSGVGGMIFNFIIGYTIPHFGWRLSYLGSGILIFLVMVPLVYFIVKDTPEEMGLRPYGCSDDPGDIRGKLETDGITLTEALRRPTFYILLIFSTCFTISFTSMGQIISPYLTDIGYSYGFAAAAVSLSMASLAIGKTTLGIIYDKTGPRIGTLFSGFCAITALGALVLAKAQPAVYVFIPCMGMGCAFGTVAFPLLTEVLFGHKDYASIYGIMTFAGSLGGALSPIITSTYYDLFGTYQYAFMTFFVVDIFATAYYCWMMPSKKSK